MKTESKHAVLERRNKLPHGHIMSATSAVPCQFCAAGTAGTSRTELATICVYRAGPAFDYYCDACADKPGPLGPTPRERAMGKS
jgi:hypothetical protein